VFRWGGDEFVVILPDFTTEEAHVTAERIRIEIENAKLGGDEIAVTASIGVCSTDRVEEKTLDGVVKCADAAMYESKFPGGQKERAGRNRVFNVASCHKAAHCGCGWNERVEFTTGRGETESGNDRRRYFEGQRGRFPRCCR